MAMKCQSRVIIGQSVCESTLPVKVRLSPEPTLQAAANAGHCRPIWWAQCHLQQGQDKVSRSPCLGAQPSSRLHSGKVRAKQTPFIAGRLCTTDNQDVAVSS